MLAAFALGLAASFGVRQAGRGNAGFVFPLLMFGASHCRPAWAIAG